MCVSVWFSDDPDPEGQGFCQAGFSVDFTKVKIAATTAHYRHDNPPAHISSPCQSASRGVSSNTRLPFEIYGLWEDESTFVPRGASTPDMTHRL